MIYISLHIFYFLRIFLLDIIMQIILKNKVYLKIDITYA